MVTGGSGYIGGHLVDGLLKKGYNVNVLDPTKPRQKGVQWFKGDILNPMDVGSACRNVEVIYHLAAIADVNVAITNPEHCIKVNEIGTAIVLETARALEIERVILASSTWVYGQQEKVSEESHIPYPNHIYAKTKIGQEQLLHAWNAIYGLPYTILRYGIPYGPRMRSNLVLAIFIRRARLGDSLTIFGDGKQGRCFIYVEDLVEGNISAMKMAGKNEIFNLAGSEFITIDNIVNTLKKHFSELNVIYEPSRPGDFIGTKVDTGKATRLLGWKPKTPFEIGVKKYLDYVEETYRERSYV